MANINTGSFAKALEPGVQKWYGMGYNSRGEQCKEIFEKRTSKRAYEEIMGTSWFGMAAVVPEGQPVPYDTAQQGYYTRFTHLDYKLGFVITKNAIADNQYMELAEARAKALGRSKRITRETVAANVYNRATTAGYTGGDGVTLLNASHPNKAGGTYSNLLAVAADLSEAALEQAEIEMAAWTDDRGLLIAATPRKLVVAPANKYEAERILNSALRVGTADNDLNALATTRTIPEGYTVNHYLTDADQWFILTDVDNGMIHFEREADNMGADNDFDTSNAKFKVEGRESFGWADPKGVFGSPGV
ncbi:MAG: Mu-like prophage major head subunit gpT family protein [Gammaproteobacteria bacterium]|nr:Mu-like prophage major head subunit gpT family protein [Gammaproteobacteria bacterium]